MFKRTKKKSRSVDDSPLLLLSEDVDPLRCVFGQPLDVAAERSDPLWKAIPGPIHASVAWLNQYGLEDEGLYRVPGSLVVFSTYKALFDRGVNFSFSELQERSAHNVAMVVIRYLQALPEPIYTKKYEAHVKLALSIADCQERSYVLRSILCKLPLANRETIRLLIDHLRKVVERSNVNRMTIRNLEITWSLSIGQWTGSLVKALVESDLSMPSTLQFHVSFYDALRNSCLSSSDIGNIKVPATVSACVNWLLDHKSYKKRRLISNRVKPEMVPSLVHAFNSGRFDLSNDLQDRDVVILLQCWIQSLPKDGGLIPEEVIRDLRNLPPIDTCDSSFQSIILRLPESNLETIRVLVSFLHKIIQERPDKVNEKRLCSKFFNTGHPSILSVYTVLTREYSEIFEGVGKEPTKYLEDVVTSDVVHLSLLASPLLHQRVSSSYLPKINQPREAKEKPRINIDLAMETSRLQPNRVSETSRRRSHKGRSKKKMMFV